MHVCAALQCTIQNNSITNLNRYFSWHKLISEMTYCVSSGALNPAHSLTSHSINCETI